MNTASPRLDRLSALLDGLSPTVAIVHAGALDRPLAPAAEPPPHLYLHLLLAGTASYRDAHGTRRLDAPAAVVLQGGAAHVLQGDGDSAELLAAGIRFAGPSGGALHAAFARPSVLALAGADADVAYLLALIGAEVRGPRCGHRSLLTHAVEMFLITLLRHIIARPGSGDGMLAALADARIARAVVAMNEEASRPWRLELLAETAGMSRTAFAAAFRARMGLTPGRYLAGLRLALAEQSIAAGNGLKRAAQAAGYASPAALSRALSRRRRTSPPPV